MKCWPRTPLADAYWFQEGPGVRKWQFRNSGIKLLNVANITKGGVLDLSKTDRYLDEKEVTEKYSHFLADEGDLVIASSGISFDEDGLLRTRGVFVRAQHLPLCINTSTVRFKPKEDVSTLAWLRYWLDSIEFREQITRLVTGSAQQNFGPSHLKATKISLPPVSEQERIVRLLDEADELRKLRSHADRRTDTLIPALFHEMFGEQQGWPILRVEDAGRVQLGRQRAPKYQTGKFTRPYVRVANVYEDEIDVSDLLSMDFDERDFKQYRLEYGDILLNEGQSTELVGRPAMWRDEVPDCCFQNTLVRFQPDRTRILPDFALALFLTYYRTSEFAKISSKTSNVAHLGAARFARMPFVMPPLPLQKEFAKQVTHIRELEARQAESRTCLDALFQSMLHRAFKGEL